MGGGHNRQRLDDLVQTARWNNSRRGVTGALIFDGTWFVQVLEGAPDAVLPLFGRIEEDERHTGVSLIQITEIGLRCFDFWSMIWAKISSRDLASFEHYLVNGEFRPDLMNGFEMFAFMCQLAAGHA